MSGDAPDPHDGWVRVRGTASAPEPVPVAPPAPSPAPESKNAQIGLGLAVAGLFVPCFPVLLPLAGAVLGAIALSRGEPRRRMAIAAVVLGLLAAIGHVVLLIVFVD